MDLRVEVFLQLLIELVHVNRLDGHVARLLLYFATGVSIAILLFEKDSMGSFAAAVAMCMNTRTDAELEDLLKEIGWLPTEYEAL